jgi:ADP-ribose pyrophosphatase YjhB (NUDIX family)
MTFAHGSGRMGPDHGTPEVAKFLLPRYNRGVTTIPENPSTDPIWLHWAQQLQAIAQSGLAFSKDPYDRERYEQVRELAAEIMARQGQADKEQLVALFSAEGGYATPKVDVRGVVFDNAGRLLLVRELADGGWTLPGGWVDVGEPPSLAVEREVREESGYVVRACKLLAVYDRSMHGHPPYPFHAYKLFIRCQLLGGQAETSLETGGAEFFARDQLPPLSLMRTTPQQLERMFAHFDHPEWPADFD